jgi:predicted esterase
MAATGNRELAQRRRRTAVFGVSPGAELALAMGLRHPDIYSAILCASPGAAYQPSATLPDRLPRTYLVAGTEEPFFLANATGWADAFHGGRGRCHGRTAGSHGNALWKSEFPLMVEWAFGH